MELIGLDVPGYCKKGRSTFFFVLTRKREAERKGREKARYLFAFDENAFDVLNKKTGCSITLVFRSRLFSAASDYK